MRLLDALTFAWIAIASQRSRSLLTALGIGIGIAAVVILTALAGGIRETTRAQFTQFGTDVLVVTPGRTTTMGVSGAVINTVRPLRLEDVDAIAGLAQVKFAAGVVAGNVEVEGRGRTRRTAVYGVHDVMPEVWSFPVANGRFFTGSRSEAVLGSTVAQELFPRGEVLGAIVRLGGSRYRVVGVMEPKGDFLGIDLDDAVYISAARGLELFDRESLMEIDIKPRADLDESDVLAAVEGLLLARHGGEDFTLTSQQRMLEVFDTVMVALTGVVAALGGVSLLVGALGVFTIMTISTRERIGEIGLLRSLGAPQATILRLFLLESAMLAGIGGLAGLALGVSGALAVRAVLDVSVHFSFAQVATAESVAVGVGVLAGLGPALISARRAPVEALRTE